MSGCMETQKTSNLFTMRNMFVLTLILCSSMFLLPNQAQAQKSDRDRIIENMLKELSRDDMGTFGNDREQLFPENSGSHNRAPQKSDQNTIREIRRVAHDFNIESRQLVNKLYDAQYGERAVKSFLIEALQVTASARILERKTQDTDRLSEIILVVESLDREWRVLSKQLHNYASYNSSVKNSVNKLNSLDDKLIRLAGSRPQLNLKTIIRECHSIEHGLDKLIEDIRYEIPNSQARNDLIYDGNQLKYEVNDAIDSVYDQANEKKLVALYKNFQDGWYPFASKLRNYNKSRIDRRVQDIQNSNTRLRELFLLPQKIDRQQLIYLTDKLVKDVDYFFARTPLKLIIELRDADLALATANEFYGVFENFADNVNDNANFSELADAFSYIEESWQDFNRIFKSINSSNARVALQRIEQSMHSLRSSLQVEDKYDQTEAINLAAQIDNLTSHLNFDVKTWLNKDKNFTYRSETLRESELFARESEQFNRAIVNGQSSSRLQTQFNDLYSRWGTVYRLISKCRTAHRPHLGRQASKITPAMVRMRTLLRK
jgi:hypothetical protein